MRGQCENCKKKIPDNQWVCEECFPYFDGEKFLDPEDCEITFVTGLQEPDDDHSPKPGFSMW